MPRMTTLHRALATALGIMYLAAPVAAQQIALGGTVVDSISGVPVDGVRIEALSSGGPIARTLTDRAGRFSLEVGPGTYTLRFTRLSYHPQTREAVRVAAGATPLLTIRLAPLAFTIDPVVASASRVEEKALEAPAAVAVVDSRAIEERPALTPVDHVTDITGVVVATTGLTQYEVVARGFNNVASGALLTMTDNRYASVPSLRINVHGFVPLTNEDVERIEVVRGPGSALYGPNAANGVLHIITRSPFDGPGTSVSFTGGERSLVHGQFRYASTVGSRVGVKISGQYMRGEDWEYVDPTEREYRQSAIDAGADPDTLHIGRRDPTIERVGGELLVEWRPQAGTAWTTTVGVNQALRNVELTPLGAAQVEDWRYSYFQSRIRRGRLFGQVYVNASSAGDTYLLRTGVPIVDRSQMFVAQVQHGTLLGSSLNLTYGVDLQRTVPRTDGTITGQNEDDDTIDEAGAYLQSEAALLPAVRLVAAGRVDYHNRLANPVLSPRAAIVVESSRHQTLRFTYNRAFSTPTTNQLFLDLVADRFPTPIPIPVRLVGVPSTGFSYRRDCDGGLCMRSPYTPLVGLGAWDTYLPLDATMFWPLLVRVLADSGIDISQIPAPTAADVATVLQRYDLGSGDFESITDVRDIPALKPTIENVLELGYKAVLLERVTLGVDLYRVWKNDFVGAERVETPNAFVDRETLAAYLRNFMPAGDADSLASVVSQLPIGTVTPQEARNPFDVLITYRNFGKVRYWGADVEIGALLSRSLAVRASYSWTSDDQFSSVSAAGDAETIPLNAPANRGAFSVLYRNDVAGVNAEVRGRWAAGYPLSSGVYVGDVGAYGVVDATVGYRLPTAIPLTVTLNALNLLNDRHREFIGAPEIGRLVTGTVRAEF